MFNEEELQVGWVGGAVGVTGWRHWLALFQGAGNWH